MVKTLVFPARLGRVCPEELLDVFEKIINLVGSLHKLNITFRCVEEINYHEETSEFVHVIPMEEGRHGSLHDLTIYGPGATPGRFPAGMTAHFVHLKILSLQGVFLSEPVLADTTPPLPKLYSLIAFMGNAAIMMDDWLLSCPKLGHVAVTGRQRGGFSLGADEPPMKVLVHGKLNYVCLSGLREKSMGRWLASCESVRALGFDWDLFSICDAGMFHLDLYQVLVEISLKDEVSLDIFERSLGEDTSYDHLTVTLWQRNKSFEHIEGALKQLCAELEVTLVIDDRSRYREHDELPSSSSRGRVFTDGLSEELQTWEMAKT
ncbi:hypothetical protein FRC17_000097 [Serendipita sp. 399]|nr:hypothetical protein FRC17_000097 [Serendipita sp. 399]